MRIDVGFSHDPNGSPLPLPTGPRPEPTPPIAAPKQNGTSTEDRAKTAPKPRASRIVAAWPRTANAPPRRMIPKAARKSGTYSVDMIEPKNVGNAVHSTTSRKISHTWLASHTGL